MKFKFILIHSPICSRHSCLKDNEIQYGLVQNDLVQLTCKKQHKKLFFFNFCQKKLAKIWKDADKFCFLNWTNCVRKSLKVDLEISRELKENSLSSLFPTTKKLNLLINSHQLYLKWTKLLNSAFCVPNFKKKECD